jgi:zinc/manganese transport system permease protein
VLGVCSGVAGLWASRAFDLAAGGSVGLATTLVFVLALAWRRVRTIMARENTA